MRNFLQVRIVYHSIAWVLLSLTFFLLISRNSELLLGQRLSMVLYIMIPMLFVVYAHFWIRDYFFKQRKYLLYAIGLCALIGAGLFLDWLLSRFLYSTSQPITQTMINFASFILVSSGFQYFKRGLVNQYYNQELKARNVEAELKMLRAQLNPHFMFNTLNNIYAINELDPKMGSTMILSLSEVMRYHLESTKLQFVTLSEEVKLLKSYIELEKLRLSDSTKLNLDLETYDSKLKVSPVLLLPFVENAFKYGSHPTKSSAINISLQTNHKTIDFHVSNTIMASKNVVKTHIGLENTKKRLELIYPEKHQLTITDDHGMYDVKLQIHV